MQYRVYRYLVQRLTRRRRNHQIHKNSPSSTFQHDSSRSSQKYGFGIGIQLRRLLSLVRKPDGQRQRQQTNLPLQVATTTSTDTTGSAAINKNRLL